MYYVTPVHVKEHQMVENIPEHSTTVFLTAHEFIRDVKPHIVY